VAFFSAGIGVLAYFVMAVITPAEPYLADVAGTTPTPMRATTAQGPGEAPPPAAQGAAVGVEPIRVEHGAAQSARVHVTVGGGEPAPAA